MLEFVKQIGTIPTSIVTKPVISPSKLIHEILGAAPERAAYSGQRAPSDITGDVSVSVRTPHKGQRNGAKNGVFSAH